MCAAWIQRRRILVTVALAKLLESRRREGDALKAVLLDRADAMLAIVDKLTPYDLWAEIVEKKNVALAIVVGSMCIAIGLMIDGPAAGSTE